MIIAFETKSLRQICESYVKAKLNYGELAAKKLKHRLADLLAATAITDIIVGKPSKVNDMGIELYKINIHGDLNLYISSNHNANPLSNDHIDWSKVTRIKIIKIGSDNDR